PPTRRFDPTGIHGQTKPTPPTPEKLKRSNLPPQQLAKRPANVQLKRTQLPPQANPNRPSPDQMLSPRVPRPMAQIDSFGQGGGGSFDSAGNQMEGLLDGGFNSAGGQMEGLIAGDGGCVRPPPHRPGPWLSPFPDFP